MKHEAIAANQEIPVQCSGIRDRLCRFIINDIGSWCSSRFLQLLSPKQNLPGLANYLYVDSIENAGTNIIQL